MEVIERTTILESELTTNVTNANADWAVGTTYTTDDLVTHNKKVWKAVTGSTGSEPTETNTDWLFQEYANKWRWEDKIIGTKTTNTDTITMTISDHGSLINGIAFFGLVGDEITVSVTDATDGVVYTNTQSLTISEDILSWYDYFFEPYAKIRDTVFIDLPQYFGTGVDLDITIDNTGDTAEVGEVVLGKVATLGDTIYPLQTRILDFSRKTTDDNGNFIIEEKPFVKLADFAVSIDAGKMSVVQNRLSDLRNIPTVYIGDVNLKNSIVYGFYKDFTIVFDTPPLATCNISVNGLV